MIFRVFIPLVNRSYQNLKLNLDYREIKCQLTRIGLEVWSYRVDRGASDADKPIGISTTGATYETTHTIDIILKTSEHIILTLNQLVAA